MTGCGATKVLRGGHPVNCDRHRGEWHWDACCGIAWRVAAEPAPPRPIRGHALAEVGATSAYGLWVCECGTQGRAFGDRGEDDLARRAERNHRAHARRAITKRGKNRP